MDTVSCDVSRKWRGRRQNGTFLSLAAAFLITDPKLLLDAPRDYFVAGLADTLAKWYESETILRQAHLQGEPFYN